MSSAATRQSELLDRQVQIETPEQVKLAYNLADLGSRFTALLLDTLILTGILLATGAASLGLVFHFGTSLPFSVSFLFAVLVLFNFALIWGYFALFEGLRNGQTPGKRAMGLRVIRDGGYPLDMRGALIRNLLRVIDLFPPPAGLVGGTVMLVHPLTKRVGDIVAGTIVVRDRGEPTFPEVHDDAHGEEHGRPRLSDEEFESLDRYVARRAEMADRARARVSRHLLARFSERIPGLVDAEGGDAALLLQLHSEESRRRGGGPNRAGSAQAAALLRRQQGRWHEYRGIVQRRGSLARMDGEEVSAFASLYRETAADLARARSYGASPDLVHALERWVGAGHNLIYRRPTSTAQQAWRWLTRGFPAMVRVRWKPIALAALLLFGPMLVTGIVVHREPASARQILPASMVARAESGAARQAEGLGYIDVPEVGMSIFASQLISNNVQVSFIAFAGGVLAGLGTVAVLVLNGVSIGAAFGLFAAHDLSGYLLAFILPHGVLELAAISIAGGAGLWMGSALVLPGRLSRGAALVARGRDAVELLAGATVLLLIAGIIEAFISPAPLPFALKAAVGALSATLLAIYLVPRAPSSPEPTPSPASEPAVGPDQSSARALISR